MVANKSFKSWQLLSYVHFHSAHFFSRNAMQIEREYTSRRKPLARLKYIKLQHEHQAYVIGSIFSAAAFLDAMINELFLEADKYIKGEHAHQYDFVKSSLPPDAVIQDTLTPLPPDVIDSMADVWRANHIKSDDYQRIYKTLNHPETEKSNRPRKWSVLNRFQLALYLANKRACSKNFDKNDQLWKEVDLLINLRHYLMHYSPEWIEFSPHDESYKAQEKKTARLAEELRKRDFRNPLDPENVSLAGSDIIVSNFGKLLGSNCADWAVKYSSKFACEFAKRMPVEMYEKMYCE